MKKTRLQVGLPISIEMPGVEGHVRTRVLGWEEGRFLIARLPLVPGRREPIRAGDFFPVRFLKDNNAFGFMGEVIWTQLAPDRLLFFRYPETFETVAFRKYKRYHTNIPAKLIDSRTASIVRVIVKDFAERGCLVEIEEPGKAEFRLDGSYYLTLNIVTASIENIHCKLRNKKVTDDRETLGMEFSRATEEERNMIASFIDFLSQVVPEI